MPLSTKKCSGTDDTDRNKERKDDTHVEVEAFSDPDIVSTKLVKKLHDVTKDPNQIDDAAAIVKSKKGFVGVCGEGDDFFHDPQSFFQRAMAQVMIFQCLELNQSQIGEWKRAFHSQEDWIHFFVILLNPGMTVEQEVHKCLKPADQKEVKVIANQLAHMEPSVLFGRICKSEVKANAGSNIWRGATMNLGSWCKQEKDAKKSNRPFRHPFVKRMLNKNNAKRNVKFSRRPQSPSSQPSRCPPRLPPRIPSKTRAQSKTMTTTLKKLKNPPRCPPKKKLCMTCKHPHPS